MIRNDVGNALAILRIEPRKLIANVMNEFAIASCDYSKLLVHMYIYVYSFLII